MDRIQIRIRKGEYGTFLPPVGVWFFPQRTAAWKISRRQEEIPVAPERNVPLLFMSGRDFHFQKQGFYPFRRGKFFLEVEFIMDQGISEIHEEDDFLDGELSAVAFMVKCFGDFAGQNVIPFLVGHFRGSLESRDIAGMVIEFQNGDDKSALDAGVGILDSGHFPAEGIEIGNDIGRQGKVFTNGADDLPGTGELGKREFIEVVQADPDLLTGGGIDNVAGEKVIDVRGLFFLLAGKFQAGFVTAVFVPVLESGEDEEFVAGKNLPDVFICFGDIVFPIGTDRHGGLFSGIVFQPLNESRIIIIIAKADRGRDQADAAQTIDFSGFGIPGAAGILFEFGQDFGERKHVPEEILREIDLGDDEFGTFQRAVFPTGIGLVIESILPIGAVDFEHGAEQIVRVVFFLLF